MAADSEFVSYLLELMESFGVVSARKMFGGYGIYRDGLMFGLVADDMLYLKVDEQNREDFEERDLQAFEYDKKGKKMKMSYYQAPEDAMENSEEMCVWAGKAFAAALRAAAKKSKKK